MSTMRPRGKMWPCTTPNTLSRRSRGFSSWTKLKAYAEASQHPRHTRLFVADMQWITDRVHGLLRMRRSAGPAPLEQIRIWYPRFEGCPDEEILQAQFTETDAQLVYAREHGFDTWDDLVQRVNLLASASNPEVTEPFLGAFRALQAGDAAMLNSLLRRHPRLAQERGANGNTLLNLAVSVGKSDPDAEAAFVEMLLAAGADVNDPNDRGWTPLHEAAYCNQCPIAATLIERGADLDSEAHGSGGTPLIVTLGALRIFAVASVVRGPHCVRSHSRSRRTLPERAAESDRRILATNSSHSSRAKGPHSSHLRARVLPTALVACRGCRVAGCRFAAYRHWG
jgi:hypothetical protein